LGEVNLNLKIACYECKNRPICRYARKIHLLVSTVESKLNELQEYFKSNRFDVKVKAEITMLNCPYYQKEES